jgi:hypothetical protein
MATEAILQQRIDIFLHGGAESSFPQTINHQCANSYRISTDKSAYRHQFLTDEKSVYQDRFCPELDIELAANVTSKE